MAALGQDASGRSSRLTTRQDQIELFGEACELSAPAVRFGLQGGRSGGALLVLSRFEQRPRLSVPPRLFANLYFAATTFLRNGDPGDRRRQRRCARLDAVEAALDIRLQRPVIGGVKLRIALDVKQVGCGDRVVINEFLVHDRVRVARTHQLYLQAHHGAEMRFFARSDIGASRRCDGVDDEIGLAAHAFEVFCEAARLAFERSRRHVVTIGLQGGDKRVLQRRSIAVFLGHDLVIERLRRFARDFGRDGSGSAAGDGRTEDASEGNGGRSRYGALRGDFTLSQDRYRNGIGRTHYGDAVNAADALRVEINFADVGAASQNQCGDANRHGEFLFHNTILAPKHYGPTFPRSSRPLCVLKGRLWQRRRHCPLFYRVG